MPTKHYLVMETIRGRACDRCVASRGHRPKAKKLADILNAQALRKAQASGQHPLSAPLY